MEAMNDGQTQHLERSLAHTAAHRGLNQRIEGEISAKSWSLLRYFLVVFYFLICIPPGLLLCAAGASAIVSPHPLVPSAYLGGALMVFAGLSWGAIGLYLIRHVLRK